MTESQAHADVLVSDVTGHLRVSPMHEYWAARSTVNAWTSRGGYAVPDILHDPVEETAAFGVSAAFADISDRVLWIVKGENALAFLSALTGEDGAIFQAGVPRRIVWCDALGHVRGSGHAALRAPNHLVLATTVRDAAWFGSLAQVFAVALAAKLAAGLRVAGPDLMTVLEAGGIKLSSPSEAVAPGLGPVSTFWPAEGAVDLWCEPEQAAGLAWLIERAGARPAGARALNAWRVANGLLAAGEDWTPAALAIHPAQVRRRADLIQGGYMVAAWDSAPPGAANAVYWPSTGQFFSIFSAAADAGRATSAPFGGIISGSAATD